MRPVRQLFSGGLLRRILRSHPALPRAAVARAQILAYVAEMIGVDETAARADQVVRVAEKPAPLLMRQMMQRARRDHGVERAGDALHPVRRVERAADELDAPR